MNNSKILLAVLAVITVIAALTMAATARAESPTPTVKKEASPWSFDWQDATDDENRGEYNRLMQRGRRSLLASAESFTRREASELAISAAELFARAAKLRPDDAKAHYYAAESLSSWDDYTYLYPKHINSVIHHLTEFIRLSPYDSRIASAIFARSIAYTKLGGNANIRKALADYEFRLQMENQLSLDSYDRGEVGLILSNSAELYMYIGELDRAIGLYYDSLEYAAGESAILYRYGLAVALDRDGQRTRAQDVIKEAVRSDSRGPLGQLTRPSVFFIPEGDIHYYRALGYEALGDRRKAATFYKKFLAILPDSQFADRARENLEALGKSK